MTVRKLLRYAAVSGVSTTVSQVVLAVLVATRSTGAVTANVIATMIGTVPSFELNRRWVWGKRGRRSIGGEVMPFVVLSACGLGLSSVSVAVASHFVEHFSTTTRTLTIQLASLAAFGIVWLIQFAVLDKFLFKHPTADSQQVLVPL
jgi:putative flippase GtrA